MVISHEDEHPLRRLKEGTHPRDALGLERWIVLADALYLFSSPTSRRPRRIKALVDMLAIHEEMMNDFSTLQCHQVVRVRFGDDEWMLRVPSESKEGMDHAQLLHKLRLAACFATYGVCLY